MKKAKLVKRAEMTILGTVALALFCSAHVPDILSALDTANSIDPVVYTASAATPYVENSATVPAPISEATPVSEAATDAEAATGSPETTITVSALTATTSEETSADSQ